MSDELEALQKRVEDIRERAEKATKGPLAWQKFGAQWCLTGQYGTRPIVLSLRPINFSKAVFNLRDPNLDLLIEFTPDHPDAQQIAHAAEDIPWLLDQLRYALNRLELWKRLDLKPALEAENADLRQQLALEQKRVKELGAERDSHLHDAKTFRAIVKSDCESLEEAKASLRGVLTDHEIDGDSYMVPCAFVLITTLKEKLDQLRAERDELRRVLDGLAIAAGRIMPPLVNPELGCWKEVHAALQACAALTESKESNATPGSPAV